METRLEAINKQIQTEKVRHKQSLDNENNLHQQRMRMFNSQKEQIKRTAESFLYNRMNKKFATLDNMYETLQKATADFI